MPSTLSRDVCHALYRTLSHSSPCAVTGVRRSQSGANAFAHSTSSAFGRSLDCPPLGSRGSGLAPLNQGFAATRLPDLRPGARVAANRLHQSIRRPPSRGTAGRARRLRRREPPFNRPRSPIFPSLLRKAGKTGASAGSAAIAFAFGKTDLGFGLRPHLERGFSPPRPARKARAGKAGSPGPRLYVPCRYVPRSLGPHRFEFGPRAARSGSDPREERAGSLPLQTLVDANSNWTMGGLRPGASVTVAHPWAPATEAPAPRARAGGAAHALRTSLACWVRGPFVPLPEAPAIRQSAPAPMERAAGGLPGTGSVQIRRMGDPFHWFSDFCPWRLSWFPFVMS